MARQYILKPLVLVAIIVFVTNTSMSFSLRVMHWWLLAASSSPPLCFMKLDSVYLQLSVRFELVHIDICLMQAETHVKCLCTCRGSGCTYNLYSLHMVFHGCRQFYYCTGVPIIHVNLLCTRYLLSVYVHESKAGHDVLHNAAVCPGCRARVQNKSIFLYGRLHPTRHCVKSLRLAGCGQGQYNDELSQCIGRRGI